MRVLGNLNAQSPDSEGLRKLRPWRPGTGSNMSDYQTLIGQVSKDARIQRMQHSRRSAVYIVALIALWYATTLAAQQALPQTPDSASNKENSSSEKLPAAGMHGVSLPVCTYMPRPPITKEAKAAKFHGAVILDAVVELDGRITKIRVIKGAGLGLDESAINTLKKWKCKPALKDGKPVLADTPFQLTFDSN